jgi:hypothetical protein
MRSKCASLCSYKNFISAWQPRQQYFSEQQEWLREVLFAGWTGGGLCEAWEDLLGAIEALAIEAGATQKLILAHGPELPENRSPGTTMGEIVAHFESGRTLGFWTHLTRRGWHQLIDECRIEGRPPAAPDEFRALAKLLEGRDSLNARWRRAVESIGGPAVESLGRYPERTARASSP